jgi:hypothetical protein
MVTLDIQSDIKSIEELPAIREETNFVSRLEAIDFIEFNVIERIEGLLERSNPHESLVSLKRHAQTIKQELEDIDEVMFRRLRADLEMAGCPGTTIKGLIDKYVGPDSRSRRQEDDIGYDCLDTFINGLLNLRPIPLETKAREPGMVYFQKTPARIVLEMAEKAHFTQEDVFYDLGSGLGQVPILVNMLSGVAAKGIEFEPAYCEYARACAAAFNLPRVEFIQADARAADYSAGTVYFLYSSFEGQMLEEVLGKLKSESQRRIRLFAFGPCTLHVSRQDWLRYVGKKDDHGHKLGLFESLGT